MVPNYPTVFCSFPMGFVGESSITRTTCRGRTVLPFGARTTFP